MADPNSIADIFDAQVQFVPAVANGRFGFGNPTFVSEFATSPSFTGRIKAYTGTVTEKLALLVADGFATTSDAYKQVQTAGLQDGPARTVYVGRKDAGDADWGDAIEAIKAQADTDELSFYAFTCATRDVTEIEAIADYLEGDPTAPVFAFYLAQTDDANVYADNAGNLARNILAKEYKRIALLWHDPETASGYGPAVLESVAGPFSIADSATIQLQIDGGGTQTFTFSAAAATLTGSNTETFAVTSGDTLILSTNGGSAQTVTYTAAAASITCLNAETYDIADGDTLQVRVDGAAAQTVTFNGTAGTVTTSNAETYALNDGEQVVFSIDGGSNQTATFNTADFVDIANATAAEVAAVLTTDITGVTVTSSTTVTITSDRLGTSSDVEIVSGTGTALTVLGLSVGNNVGTGFAAFLDAATAAEVAAEINGDTTGCTAAASSTYVKVTSDTIGTSSRIQIAGGTANGELGFDTNEVAGSGDFADASAATALEMAAVINAQALGVVATTSVGAVVLTSTVLGTSSVIDVDASTIATTLGFSLTAATGSGDFADASSATAAEVAILIGTTLTGATASSAESKVKITSATSGVTSTVEAVGGTLLNTFRFVDATTAVSNLATGTGVLEDYADAAWMGRCITFDLDAANGAALWDKQELKGPSPTGSGTITLAGDKTIDSTTRTLLHDTLRVNTYEYRLGRNETHFGTLLNDQLGAGGYIDVRTTVDWMDARITEKFNDVTNAAADAKRKYAYAPSGIDVYDASFREVLKRAETNGHTFYDSSPLDLNDPQDTGIYTPTVAEQLQADINNRKVAGFQARQLIQGGIQRGSVIVNLIGPVSSVG